MGERVCYLHEIRGESEEVLNGDRGRVGRD